MNDYFVTVVRVNGHLDSAYIDEAAADAFAGRRNSDAAEAERRARAEGRILHKRVWTTETIRLYRPGDERP